MIHNLNRRGEEMSIFQNIINHKVNSMTGSELLKYAKQFQISISRAQADKIAAYLRGKNFNIFDSGERVKITKEISKIAGAETAKEVNRLFENFSK